jgi:hypothetical protein
MRYPNGTCTRWIASFAWRTVSGPPSQDRAAAAVFLSFRRAIAWGDRTSRRCSAAAAACWSSGLIMPLGLPSLS